MAEGRTNAPRTSRPNAPVHVGDHSYVLAVEKRTDERARVLKHDETFGVFDPYGDIISVRHNDHGLYHAGMRHLSHLDLAVNGFRPLFLSSSVDRDNVALAIDLTNPDLSEHGRIALQRGTVHLRRVMVVWRGVLYLRVRAHNFGLEPTRLRLGLRFEADFADMFEVRGVRRLARGEISPGRDQTGAVVYEYRGLDRVARRTVIRAQPPPALAEPGRVEYDLGMPPGGGAELEVRFECSAGSELCAALPGEVACRAVADRAAAFAARSCEVRSSSESFDAWVARSVADLRLMISDTAHGLYPYAGVPWFSTPFGRDGIITALQTLWVDPDIARGVLGFLAATQSADTRPEIDAEPGKIVHEIRSGEMAATGEVPYARYYGSVDSTPLFVLLAGEYLRATGDAEFARALWPAVARALDWIERHGDRDGDGLVEYQSHAPNGLANQGWKDSNDSVFHEDGTAALLPVALAEVQAYVHGALLGGAEIADLAGDSAAAGRLRTRAGAQRDLFGDRFWDERLGLYVLALDGLKRPCRVASSNAGQCLFTGIARPEHAQRVVREMLSPRFLSGWGVRTIATDQPRYNPMSYHNGSVWPHDTSLIALGMSRYGCTAEAARLLDAAHDLSRHVELQRMPELLCGFERREGEGPVRYPVACSPQAWAAGAVFLLLQASLGLSVRADRRELVFQDPCLPEFLKFVELRNLRVGPVRVDVVIQRRDEGVTVHLVRRATGVRLIVTR